MASILLPGHVVRFVPPGSDEPAPSTLPIVRPLRRSARVIIAVLLVAAAVVAAGSIFLLWTEPTPGVWFSLLFTVMITGLVTALVLAYIGAVRDGRARAEARDLWSRAPKRAVEHARVIAREVSTQEDGQVGSFEVTVLMDGGNEVRGRWSLPTASSRAILQSQVPVIGQRVRVWRLAAGSGDGAHVIDVVDPSAAYPAS
ncbi:hypothetical protein [Microbacterium sp. ZW T5_56]|uniref:hypothetical protein n=1 Tax=Microbacterium sp. ZW T5_56 TaxID=3378081 RepID=UPI0038534556